MKFYRKILKYIFFSLIFWVSTLSSISAARLYFSPASNAITNGQTGTLTVYVDTEGKLAYGVEGVLNITGTSVNFTRIDPAGTISSSELTSEILANQLKFRIVVEDDSIQNTQAIVTISYTAVAAGETDLDFVTTGNFNSSLIAEEVTGDNILTSASGALLDVSANGTTITPTPTGTIILVPSGTPTVTNAVSSPSDTPTQAVTTPSSLPKSGSETNVFKIVILSSFLLLGGVLLVLIQKTSRYDPLSPE